MRPEPMDDAQAMTAIHHLLDGEEWSADTLDDIAGIVESTGRAVHDLDGWVRS